MKHGKDVAGRVLEPGDGRASIPARDAFLVLIESLVALEADTLFRQCIDCLVNVFDDQTSKAQNDGAHRIDLDGYGWCVRKGDYLNVGIGRRTSVDFASHVHDFVSFLESTGKAPGAARLSWRGHAYLASGAYTKELLVAAEAKGVTMFEEDDRLLCYPSLLRVLVEEDRISSVVLGA